MMKQSRKPKPKPLASVEAADGEELRFLMAMRDVYRLLREVGDVTRTLLNR